MGDMTVNETMIGDNLRIRIEYDDSPSSPREWDNLTTIRGWHRRIVIGDGPNINADDYDGFADMIRSIVSEDGPLVMLAPLYWYEHSGTSCKMGEPMHHLHGVDLMDDGPGMAAFRAQCLDDAGWDSGVAGLVYVTRKSQANVGTPDELVVQVARSEVEEYDSWMRGDVYGYVVEIESECGHGDTHADVLESCWGFIGDSDYAMSEGMASVGWFVGSALSRTIT